MFEYALQLQQKCPVFIFPLIPKELSFVSDSEKESPNLNLEIKKVWTFLSWDSKPTTY